MLRSSSKDLAADAGPLTAFFGAPTPKTYVRGTHRNRHPEETWSLIEPHFPRFGITRVADVTGLDRIGIPVWMAVRPNSRSLSVTQGKGLEMAAARVSAAMESLEVAHGEQPSRPLRFATYEVFRTETSVIDVTSLPLVQCSLFTPHRKIFWTQAYDLISGGSFWVPYEMVHTDAAVPWMPGSGAFLASTNGLASGNTLAEAVLHGMCEVIERDALALWEHSGPQHQASVRIDLTTATNPVVTDILSCYRDAGITVMAWNATSNISVPVVRVVIFDEASSWLRPLPAAFGAGCHPDRTVALVRALTEAAQSRLTVIAGSRDDFGRARYRTTQSPEALEYHQKLARANPGRVSVNDLPSCAGATVDDDVADVLHRLRAIGVSHMLVIDLSLADIPIAVVRVIIPGLEGPTESHGYVAGPRVRALMRQRAIE